MKPTRKEVLAVAVAAISAFATVIGAVIAAIVALGPPQPSKTCFEIYNQYAAEIAKGPKQREVMLPGADGRSVLTSDPEAKYCGLEPEDFPP